MPGLSALELAVLGLVWKTGPCTPYSIRQQFLESPSSHWSGSAGAIYPLVLRLERRGLLRSRDRGRGARPGRVYSLTAAGMRHLRRWLTPPVPEEDVSVSLDAVRTRMLFLDAVGPAQRLELLEDVRAKLRAEVRKTEEIYRRESAGADRATADAVLGALMVLRARLQWISKVARSMASQR